MSYDLSMSYVLYVFCISSYILCLLSYMSYAYFVPQRTRLNLVAQVTTLLLEHCHALLSRAWSCVILSLIHI